MHNIVDGWMKMLADEVHAERILEGITEDGGFTQWELLSGVVTKHYATVGPLTSALDATFDLLKAHGFRPEEIVEIQVDCMRRTAIFNARHPENEVTARASLPYCLAVAVLKGDPAALLGPAFHEEVLRDPAVHAMADRVRITEKPEYEAQYPAKSLARVTITLADGRTVTQEVDRSARGRYLHPTDDDIENKFRLIAGPILGAERTETVIGLVRRLETLPDIGELVEALRPA
jgi:2-methylcitrate dehydratase PrpD